MASASKNTTVPFGKLGRPHGVHGEQRLFLFNPDTTLLQPGLPVVVKTDEGWRELHLEYARPGSKATIVAFEEIQSREDAAALTNEIVRVRRDDFEPARDDEIYQADLIGAPVFIADEAGPVQIGRLKGFLDAVQDTDIMAITGPNIKGRLLVLMNDETVLKLDVNTGIVLAPLEEWAFEDLKLPDIAVEAPDEDTPENS